MTVGAQHRTLRELVADAILDLIMRGELQPGDRLYEERIAEDLGVSRNPVREAIRALEATGFIEVIPRRGAYVAETDRSDLISLLEVRCLLEARAAELAATRHTSDSLAEIDRCIAEGRAASARNDLIRAAECHRDFHIAIEAASGNPYIGETVGPLRQRTELVFSMLSGSRSALSWDEHSRIRDAIAARDTQMSRACADEHIAAVIAALRST